LLVVDSAIFVASLIGRGAAVIRLIGRSVDLVTTDRTLEESQRRISLGMKRPDLARELEIIADDVFIVAVSELESELASARQALREAVPSRNGSEADAHIVALAWQTDADIWSSDRDFAGTGVASWSTPNLLRTASEASPMTAKPETDEEMAAIRVSGTVTPHNAEIYLAPYNPDWPSQYDTEAAAIRAALGERALVLDHVGSTSIPGMPAKPVLDILLAVADSADEDAYVPALTAAGFRLHLREPDWEQHRVMKGEGRLINLHVFTVGSREIERMLAFRDRCRSVPAEHQLYLETKQSLAGQVWRHVQHYANAKGEAVEAIIARALAAKATTD
jgi:GrpB-like predicted nucleotidyltransferase (UPF0157 family)/predicted nucleic acid-binding protein